MAYSYKGAISFGLVYIPIELYSTTKSNDISFNLLEKNTLTRIKYKKTCIGCDGKEVKQKDIVKGYQYDKDKYVIIEDELFEKIKTKKDHNITVESFVHIDEIDPIYYDKSFYVFPTGGQKAFDLLTIVLKKTKTVGLAKTVLGSKEKLIAIREKNNELLINTLYFNDEIKKVPEVNQNLKNINSNEIGLAKQLIESMMSKFDPTIYKDEYREKLLKAIETKIAGKEIQKPKEREEKNIVNLMEALQQSLTTNRKNHKKQA